MKVMLLVVSSNGMSGCLYYAKLRENSNVRCRAILPEIYVSYAAIKRKFTEKYFPVVRKLINAY